MEKNSKKIDSILKIFALLRLLLEDDANFSQVIKTISLSQDPLLMDKNIHSVTLNKYLNTLRLFGLNVKKEKGKYNLINPPYKIELTTTELKIFSKIKNCAKKYTAVENADFEKFIKTFELHFSENTKMLINKINTGSDTDLSFYYDKFTNKIDICSKFCNEDYKVEIIYYDKKITNEKKITAKLNELVYRNGTVYLNLINLNKSEPQTISLEKILSIKQQPKKTTTTFFTNNVVMYKLTGRLAQNYNPREWEEVYTKVDDYTIIKNSNEPEEELIKRILKYGTQCKIITPQHFKEKICNAIEKTLKLYE